ncbi:ABC-2 type transport system permease protein [Anaerotaenia torta]|uniref:ABC transporter permease n=1 Tax=Anaerotaenia torta TaxID=433293 RepID=UPI003D1B679D
MKLYMKFFGIHLKAAMQYKTSFLLTTLGQFLISFNVFLGILFMFDRFQEVRGYGFAEVLLCFSVVLMSFSLAEMFMRGFDVFAGTIGNGEFDRILLRPRNPVLLVVSGKIEFSRFGRTFQAILMLIYGIAGSGIRWDITRCVTLVLMIAGGTVVFGCLFVVYASICFFTLEGLEFMNVLTDGAREYGKYPVNIYGKRVLRFCTYIVPYALFQYYPFLYLIGRTENMGYMLLPLAGCLFLIPCFLFWKLGIRHYKSTGS